MAIDDRSLETVINYIEEFANVHILFKTICDVSDISLTSDNTDLSIEMVASRFLTYCDRYNLTPGQCIDMMIRNSIKLLMAIKVPEPALDRTYLLARIKEYLPEEIRNRVSWRYLNIVSMATIKLAKWHNLNRAAVASFHDCYDSPIFASLDNIERDDKQLFREWLGKRYRLHLRVLLISLVDLETNLPSYLYNPLFLIQYIYDDYEKTSIEHTRKFLALSYVNLLLTLVCD